MQLEQREILENKISLFKSLPCLLLGNIASALNDKDVKSLKSTCTFFYNHKQLDNGTSNALPEQNKEEVRPGF
ncbi:MAG: hypothetical protein H0T84_07825 [Tatlockia sp.]|nr:hypothetical protein [Tatlockia sp.]